MMSSTFTVRPSTEKDVFRVKLTAASLLLLKLKPGDIVLLQLPNDDGTVERPAIVWENSGSGMKDTIIQASKTLQELYGFKLGDRIGISRCSETLKDASTVVVKSLSSDVLDDEQKSEWQTLLSYGVLSKYDVLAPGQRISIEPGKRKVEVEIVDVGGRLGRITDKTTFVFRSTDAITGRENGRLDLSFEGIGGLDREISQIKEQVEFLLDTEIPELWHGFRARNGLLLYGPKGTGKTKIQEHLANKGWASVVRWTPGSKLPDAKYPRLILADLSALTDKAISELLTIFNEVRKTQTLIVGEARHPNDINEKLRSDSTFSVELELPIPDSDQRLDILRALRCGSEQPSDEQIAEIAARTHGFVGADLNKLLHRIWMTAYKRCKDEKVKLEPIITTNGTTENNSTEEALEERDSTTPPKPKTKTTITQTDIDLSLPQVRPSALQQVFLTKPNVSWTDIGGQHALKTRLTNAVQRTLSQPLRKRMLALGLEPTKGVLLYGPPGCSKTLLAKALATEAELNFLAVKGAELISMYVGESERATREVFRKARAAAPSILFFDEIDAIASRPGESSEGGGGAGSSSNLNVLTTLLNEMDGFEELKNVLVIAATNKPQAIDPALLRPGRFDYVVYVGLPDVETRREIFEKHFRNISVEDGLREKEQIEQFAASTEGYSGAEVVAICKAAGEAALDADRDFIAIADVELAIQKQPKGVNREMLRKYDNWNASRGPSGS